MRGGVHILYIYTWAKGAARNGLALGTHSEHIRNTHTWAIVPLAKVPHERTH